MIWRKLRRAHLTQIGHFAPSYLGGSNKLRASLEFLYECAPISYGNHSSSLILTIRCIQLIMATDVYKETYQGGDYYLVSYDIYLYLSYLPLSLDKDKEKDGKEKKEEE